jgi:Zn-finger nucleic acid-binding protein
MIIVECDEVEVDHCVTCKGLWLDAGELDLLLGDAEATRRLLASGGPGASASERPRKCPLCDVKMEKSDAGGVTFDRCGQGDGLWFDEGELATLLEQGEAFTGGAPVAAFLRDLFTAPPNAEG